MVSGIECDCEVGAIRRAVWFFFIWASLIAPLPLFGMMSLHMVA